MHNSNNTMNNINGSVSMASISILFRASFRSGWVVHQLYAASDYSAFGPPMKSPRKTPSPTLDCWPKRLFPGFSKRKQAYFLLARLGTVDFLHLHLHSCL